MTNNGWWWLLALGLAVGAAVSGWLTLRLSKARNEQALKRATDTLQQQNAKLLDQLRSAQSRTAAELEQLRQSHKRQMTSVDAEPRAAAARAEQSLKAAYAELDRLRGQILGAAEPTEPVVMADGFAATQPMPR